MLMFFVNLNINVFAPGTRRARFF